VERYDYDPYGQATVLTAGWLPQATSAYNWVYLFQGGRYDTATGLYHFGARDLSPTLGRWVQVDPEGFLAGDLNLYRLEENNAIDFIDPTGLDPIIFGPHYGPPGLTGAQGKNQGGGFGALGGEGGMKTNVFRQPPPTICDNALGGSGGTPQNVWLHLKKASEVIKLYGSAIEAQPEMRATNLAKARRGHIAFLIQEINDADRDLQRTGKEEELEKVRELIEDLKKFAPEEHPPLPGKPEGPEPHPEENITKEEWDSMMTNINNPEVRGWLGGGPGPRAPRGPRGTRPPFRPLNPEEREEIP
jgi:RHS repeat-associated protein